MKKSVFLSEVFRRMFAGIWFALAAVFPVGYFFALDPFDGRGLPVLGSSVILTIAIPIFLAGVCGLALGADILDAEKTKNALQAVGRGLAVSLLSYLILFTGIAVILASTGDDASESILGVLVFFLYGLLFLGWLVIIVGAAAGGLLYLLRLKTFRRE